MRDIITKEVTRKGVHLGWKVYIRGKKFPRKPEEYYRKMTEEEAKKKAIEEYRGGKQEPLEPLGTNDAHKQRV